MPEKQAFKIEQTAQERAEINRNGYSHQGYSPEKIITKLLGSIPLSNGKQVNI